MSTRKILIVDDEVELRSIVAEALELSGWEVLTAANGAEALEIVRKSSDLAAMISDVKMPVMDGRELLQQIKNSGLVIPQIYLVTGFSNLSPREAQELGAKELFRKPFDLIQLCETIEADFRAQS